QLLGSGGEIKINYNAIVCWHDIEIQTGRGGRVEVVRNFQFFQIGGKPFTGIDTMGTLTISSEVVGQTSVNENRIVAMGATIRSLGQTQVRENNFDRSGPVVVQGLLCDTGDNNPDLTCQ